MSGRCYELGKRCYGNIACLDCNAIRLNGTKREICLCVDRNQHAVKRSPIRHLRAKLSVIGVGSNYANLSSSVRAVFGNGNKLGWLADVHDCRHKAPVIPCPIDRVVHSALVDMVLEQPSPEISRRAVYINSKRHFNSARKSNSLSIPSRADIHLLIGVEVMPRLH